MIQRLQEVSDLQAALLREQAAREAATQTLSEETIRMQSQLESVTEENNRLRIALDTHRTKLENTQSLIQEGEAKIEHWKVGLENSYQQKRILKQTMRQLMEEDSAIREHVQRERRARQGLERDLMQREDVSSTQINQNEEDNVVAEFGNFDWARRVETEKNLKCSYHDTSLVIQRNGMSIMRKCLQCQKKWRFLLFRIRLIIWNGKNRNEDCC